jgi:hypothetical protein
VELTGDREGLKTARRVGPRDEADVLTKLANETGLSEDDCRLYLLLLKKGSIPASRADDAERIMKKGMAIVSGDGRLVIPVHPRLGIANQYRTWREAMVREINDRRMRVDSLILELIPLYEAATEKRTHQGAG